jgi:hypothetical protein
MHVILKVYLCILYNTEYSSSTLLTTARHVFSEQPYPGALVRKRTIPTERPPLVGEVSANFSG